MKHGRPELHHPAEIEIKPNNPTKSEFLFRLTFSSWREVEFLISAETAMEIMQGLQKYQTKYKIPIPGPVIPVKPKCRVVTDDG